MIADYEKQVYAAVLGKIIGVYMGRPFEGWDKAQIEAKWGTINRYVHEDQKVPLVVADDDISGTLTFIRALEDSGCYADTPPDFFGKTWLNYLLENQTIIWWGGIGCSTEHTAFLHLKHGIPSPRSGSRELNGRTVSEQIGAQIFIDAFGLVAPGDPELAARLAKMAAEVSHDGEAVYAAQATAAMVSAAFVEKDMERILDCGVSVIPADSLIARIHRDVRNWKAADGDWRRTYEHIAETYGYKKYEGGCHVVPNHALMVMAWAYAGADFYRAQEIINTAGWDTDCNAANVGCVCALAAGLEHLTDRYDFRSPFADRIILPTADGTFATADALEQALHIAAIGRQVMHWPAAPSPKGGAWHHFSQPGALHGYMPDLEDFAARGHAQATNAEGKALCFSFNTGPGITARVQTPIGVCGDGGGYALCGTPRLVNGMTVTVYGRCISAPANAALRLEVHTDAAEGRPAVVRKSNPLLLRPDADFTLAWTLRDCETLALQTFALAIEGTERGAGMLEIDRVECGGPVCIAAADGPQTADGRSVAGWISSLDRIFSGQTQSMQTTCELLKNEGLGLLVTGSRRWHDAAVECEFLIRMAERAGIVLNYQGTERYYAVEFTHGELRIVRRQYGETVLAAVPCQLPEGTAAAVRAEYAEGEIRVHVAGLPPLTASDKNFTAGGAGFFVENGRAACRAVRITAAAE